MRATYSPIVLVEAYRNMQLRCLCRTCLRLDALYPDEGYQLALFPLRELPDQRSPKTMLSNL